MEIVVAVIAALLVLGSIWVGDWIGRGIDEYRDDENHR
jgi:hypothetical protein